MPELTVRLLDGDSHRVLGKVGLTFSSPVREQLVIERLARLFDIEPLGGKLGAHVDQATAPGNAKALRQLYSGNNAGIDLRVKQRSAKDQPPESSRRSSDSTYQRIVVAVRTALKEAKATPSIEDGEADPMVFSSAVKALGERVETNHKVLEQVRIALLKVKASTLDIEDVPILVGELIGRVRSLEIELEDCKDDREKYKTSLEEHDAKYTLLQRDFQRLTEESNQQHLAQQLADIDMFDDEPFSSLDQGAI